MRTNNREKKPKAEGTGPNIWTEKERSLLETKDGPVFQRRKSMKSLQAAAASKGPRDKEKMDRIKNCVKMARSFNLQPGLEFWS